MKEPSCSLNTMDCTLGRSMTVSMMAKRVSGNSDATLSMDEAYWKPTARMGSWPRRAKLRSACTRWESVCISSSRKSIPVSALNFTAPL